MSYPLLKNAPINEALIDIQYKLSPSVGIGDLEKLHENFKKDFPEVKKRKKITVSVKEGKLTESSSEEIDGFLFKNSDKNRIIQFRIDGFTYNWLKPYVSWEKFYKEAKDKWDYLNDHIQIELIKRVALRYIDSMEFPVAISGLNKFLKSVPDSLKEEPDLVEHFTRFVINDKKLKAKGIKIFIFKQKMESVSSTIIDIDVYRQEAKGIDPLTIWPILCELRNFKNRLFFNSLTEEAIRFFNK